MSGAWNRVAIGDKPADVFEPARVRFGVLFLHDLDGRSLRDRLAFTQVFGEAGIACVCPSGDQAWWTDRICPAYDPSLTAERYVLDRGVPYFAEHWGLQPGRIGLLGVGMGGQGALRLSFKHPQTFPVVAAVSPIIEYQELYGRGAPLDAMYDSKEQCRQDTAILHLHPSNYPPHIYVANDPADPWFRGTDRLHEKMNALGVPHQAQFIPGILGSGYQTMIEPALRFVVAAKLCIPCAFR
jgi:S-formylglutathione hydrolase